MVARRTYPRDLESPLVRSARAFPAVVPRASHPLLEDPDELARVPGVKAVTIAELLARTG